MLGDLHGSFNDRQGIANNEQTDCIKTSHVSISLILICKSNGCSDELDVLRMDERKFAKQIF